MHQFSLTRPSAFTCRPLAHKPHLQKQPKSQIRRLVLNAAETVSSPSTAAHPIQVSGKALAHLQKLRAESGNNLLLRMGVKNGGCNGMSYDMKFEEEANIAEDDTVMNYDDGFKLVCDPKSLLYLFGMELDYSDALVGGGFQFKNPNAASDCGCGKSFSV